MLRFSAALSLAAVASFASAQTPPAPAPAPVPDAAVLNAQLAAPLPADQAAMKAHVMFLASDAMRGREAGSHEFDIAAQYVAAQFYAAGLKPGGDQGGYLQKVPLVSYKVDGDGSAVWTPTGGAAQPLVAGTDFLVGANAARAATGVTAPVVFVGYGIDAPQYRHDDYKGVDVRGKIVAFVGGAPEAFAGEERAFFGSAGTKARTAERKGAVGVITVQTRAFPARAGGGGARPAFARMTWRNPDGTGKVEAPGAPSLGTLTATGAATLFGARWAAVTKAAEAKAPRYKAIAAPGTLSVASKTTFEPAESSNVVGIIPGSDPALAGQVVILSAHLDHIGVGRGTTGDQINNGAMDNAIGIASLIEEAKRFAAEGKAPRRTIMFLAVTGEEKGLVGSDYFTNHPTVPFASIVADINFDMPILTYRFEDMIVYGADRSTLGPIVRRAITAAGVGVSPDPMPQEGIFVRSDHFRFVQKGIPAVFLWPGQKGDGKAAVEHFMSTNYHRPSDDLSQPILWDQGVRFVDVNYRIAREVADADARPLWNRGDYFAGLYGGPTAAK